MDEQCTTAIPVIDSVALDALRDLQEEGEPDFLSELIEMFMEDAELRLVSLREAIRQANASEVEKQAHALTGSCLNFGARPMAEICEEFQSVGGSGALVNASNLVDRLNVEYSRVRAALIAELSMG